MNLETKITIYKFTPQLFTLTHEMLDSCYGMKKKHSWTSIPHYFLYSFLHFWFITMYGTVAASLFLFTECTML